MEFTTVKDLIEYCGGVRTAAYRLNYDIQHLNRIMNGNITFSEKTAFRFLKQYPEIKLEQIAHLTG